MIDLHCHILHGVDDGAQTLQDSLKMAKVAISQGITHILCTPHHNNGKYENPASKVIPLVEELQKELDNRGLALTLLEGQEVRITGELLAEIKAGEILFTDLTNKYLLIEFPTATIPNYAEEIFFSLTSKGHIPVIVHPERNAGFREDPNRLISFIEMGALTQLTAPSIVGIFGKPIQKTAIQMMDHGLLHMVASDAHGVNQRNFYLKDAYDEIEKRYGKEKVLTMQQVARDLVNGDDVNIPPYHEIKKKKFNLF